MEPTGNGTPPDNAAALAYLAYSDAVRRGDLDQICAAVIPQQASQMQSPEFQRKLPIIQFMLPDEIEVTTVQQEGAEAKLTLCGKGAEEGQKGSATVILLDGKWLVAGETWFAGD